MEDDGGAMLLVLCISNDVACELERDTGSGDGERVCPDARVDADTEGDGDGLADDGIGGGEGRDSTGADDPRDWLESEKVRDLV